MLGAKLPEWWSQLMSVKLLIFMTLYAGTR